ncbi:MAG: hypothetical protein HYZ53_06605 [Planctomycetes bacterium]|nr:hypothetical protein [Planctomycetota bacterium]
MQTFDFAVLYLDDLDEIPLHGGTLAGPGPAFCVRAVRGRTWGGDEADLLCLENPEAIARIVLFDTWTLNADRYPPPGVSRRPHYDNVFFSEEGAAPGRYRLLAMDHTECFLSGGRELTAPVAGIDRIKDERVYGLFPAFVKQIGLPDVRIALDRMSAITSDALEQMLRGIPAEWALSESGRGALAHLILDRAKFLGETFLARLGFLPYP